MMARRRPRRPAGYRRLWVAVWVVVFVLVDVALVVVALAATHSDVPRTHGPIPTFSSPPRATPTPTATSTPTATATPLATDTAAAPRFLSALSATDAWRATPGSCSGADAVVEHSTDGGARWVIASTTRYAIHRVLALDGGATHTGVVGGVGDACTPRYYTTFTGGKFWAEYPDSLAGAVFIDPGNNALHLAASTVAAPCIAPLQIAKSSNGVAVLCTDVVFVRSAAASWVRLPMSGVLAVAASDSGYTLAVSGASGCSGVRIESLPSAVTAASSPTTVGCASLAETSQVTLAQHGSVLWLWSGMSVKVSTDAGATWPH